MNKKRILAKVICIGFIIVMGVLVLIDVIVNGSRL
jgi:hypothetical protein